jgi:FKBP-type peptidyl-prolyl cis-trans isomerase
MAMISVYEQYRIVWLAARVDRRMRVEKKSKQRSCRTHEENSTPTAKEKPKKKKEVKEAPIVATSPSERQTEESRCTDGKKRGWH